MAKLKVSELKKHLKTFTKEDLIRLIVELSKTSKEAQNYLAAEVQGEAKMRLSHAKKAISDFGKFADNPLLKTSLMLHYVEIGTDFTNTYGDIDGPFYNSMASMFFQVVEACNRDEHLYEQLSERLELVYRNSAGIGWGYHDNLADAYFSIEWLDDEEE